jgi:hypothetical protein
MKLKVVGDGRLGGRGSVGDIGGWGADVASGRRCRGQGIGSEEPCGSGLARGRGPAPERQNRSDDSRLRGAGRRRWGTDVGRAAPGGGGTDTGGTAEGRTWTEAAPVTGGRSPRRRCGSLCGGGSGT